MFFDTCLNNLHRRIRVSAFAFITLLLLLFYPASSARAAAGELDPTFGSGGKVVLPVINGVSVGSLNKAIVQPDGKILGIGSVRFGNPPGHTYRVGLVRLNADGTPDTSFGNGGNLIPNGVSSTIFYCDFNVQTDGKILLACQHYTTTFKGVTVYRYNPDGTPDTSFDNDGIAQTDLNGNFESNEVVVQPDGKILVGGGCWINNDFERFVLVRYLPTGALDASFGQNGVLTAPPNTNRNDGLSSILLQPDGKIIATGGSTAGGSSLVLFRYHANGTADTSFGTNGEVLTPGYAGGQSGLLPDGKIILLGGSASNNALFRYNSNGSPDASFGTNGKVTLSLVPNGRVTSFALQRDGKSVLGGYVTSTPSSGDAQFLAARFNSNGEPDASFGTNGIVLTYFGLPGGSVCNNVTIQPDGKILSVGTNRHDKYSLNPVLARFLSGGARDFDFDGDGKSDVSIFRSNAAEWYWLNSSTGESSGLQFGIGSDRVVPADFDGDGKTDIAVFRGGDWYRVNSADNSFVAVHFGQTGDKPVPADYDGDDKADLAVYRQGDWYVLNSADDSFRADHFGISTDKPVIGDFDGDGKSDLAVYRASEGIWYAQRSRDGFFGAQFGVSSDKPVAADYDGDGKTDVAVYRPSDGTWYLLRSNLGFTGVQFGSSTDTPAPADYDGDGKADLAVYRSGNWYLQQSASGFRVVQFGQASDFPIPAAFAP